MDSLLTLTLASEQVLVVTLSSLDEAHVLARIAAERAGAIAAAEIETRTYHLGDKPTANRGYDDRLTVRLGPSRSTLMEALALWTAFNGKRGGLRHTLGGSKYWVSELACREWLGDIAAHEGSLGGPSRWAARRAAGKDDGPTKL
jgi:hypothetical protein